MEIPSKMVSSLYFRLCSILSRIEKSRLESLSSFSAKRTLFSGFYSTCVSTGSIGGLLGVEMLVRGG